VVVQQQFGIVGGLSGEELGAWVVEKLHEAICATSSQHRA
jgi:hypothetical protein